MNALLYLLQVNLYLLLFYLFYLALLRNETFFKLNRFYLVGSALFSLVIPIIKAGWIRDFFVTEEVHQATQTVGNLLIGSSAISETVYPVAYSAVNQSTGLHANQIFWAIYGSIVLLLLLNFFRKLYLVDRTFKSSPKHQAFSFFKKVLIDEGLQGKETILDHEMVHVRQWHSLDVIFFELFTVFNWFNPISYAYKRAIKNIHEFIADDSAAPTLEERSAYALLLVSSVFNTQPQRLTNNFFNQSLLKRRIIMLHKTKSRKVAILKYGLSVPLFSLMLIFSSATVQKSVTVKEIAAKIEEHIPMAVNTIINEPAIKEDDFTKTDLPALKNELNQETGGSLAKETGNPALKAVADYFNKTLRYPATDQEERLTGSTYVTFELDETGAIQNPSMVSAMSAGSYYEIIRAIKVANPFGEGIQGKYILPVKFSLSAEPGVATQVRSISSKDQVDLGQFKGYQTIDGVHIRGYLSAAVIKKTLRLEVLSEYFAMSTLYPEQDKQNGLAGYNLLAFELDQAGTIQNPSFIVSMSSSAEDEIMKRIKSAKPFGDGAEGKYLLPITFQSGQPFTTTTPKLGNFSNYKRLKTVIINANGGRPIYPKPNLPVTDLPQNFTYITTEETGGSAGKIVNYIKVEYLIKPIILIDGKEASYQVTDKGFRLDDTIYPKHASIKIYTRDAAVKNFNESARERGLIVITTGSEKE